MNVAIQISEEEELKALPILLRHSPGMMLRNGTYLVDAGAARAAPQGSSVYGTLKKHLAQEELPIVARDVESP